MKTVGSMFSGIGGLDLGLEWAGWTVVWQAETEKYASRVLEKHWPDVPNLGDVTEIDWSHVRRPDLVCAGFPCQPTSYAGARRGTEDDRWLWPEVERCVRLVRPEWVLLENVPGLLTLGFGQVATGLAGCGYDMRWDCIPAAAVGAPHLRYRIFVVAHTARDESGRSEQRSQRERTWLGSQSDDVAHADRDSEPGEGPPEPCRDSTVERRCRDVADTTDNGLGRRPEQSERCEGPRDVVDTDGTARRPARPASQEILRPETVERSRRRGSSSRDFWAVEPDVRLLVDGFPERMGRGLDGHTIDADETSLDVARIVVRILRDHGTATRPPCERGPDEQLAAELADALCAMSHPLALGTREETLATTRAYVHGLRQACEAIGIVRDPSVPLAAAWQSASGETQDWILLAAGRGTWHAEWPDVPRVASGVPRRVDRLRCLGNAVVPQVAELVARMWLP